MKQSCCFTILICIFCFNNSFAADKVSITKEAVWEAYRPIKEKMQQSFRKAFKKAGSRWNEDKRSFDASDCGYTPGLDFSFDIEEEKKVVFWYYLKLFRIAREIEFYRFVGIETGYWNSSWKRSLVSLEDDLLNSLVSEVSGIALKKKSDSANAAEKKRVEGRPFEFDFADYKSREYEREIGKLPTIEDDPGCGAGETVVEIRAEPKNAAIKIMPLFFYEICEKRESTVNLDCPYWRDLSLGVLYVSGVYAYLARWPDGKTGRGKVDFDKISEQKNPIFTIRPFYGK